MFVENSMLRAQSARNLRFETDMSTHDRMCHSFDLNSRTVKQVLRLTTITSEVEWLN